MATREENLKKINDQLEQLSDEDLDAVAGGEKKPFAEVPGGVEIPITGIFWEPPEINNQNPANRLLSYKPKTASDYQKNPFGKSRGDFFIDVSIKFDYH